jgi:outer membrane protein OmpA-like peptidoglycan-associated protein
MVALALATLLPGAQAKAQPVSGVYIAGGAGVNFWPHQASGGTAIRTSDPGWVTLGSLGYGFGNGLRLEIEGSWRGGNVSAVDVNAVQRGSSGRLNNFGAMANALFDFDLSGFGITPDVAMPYVGAGIGAGWMQLSGARFSTPTSSFVINDTGTQFAYQAIAGAAFGLGGTVPGLAITAEYRFYGTLEQSLNVTRVSGPAVAGVPGTVNLENVNHSVLLGLRYSFNAAPAPAAAPQPAAAPPPAARTYLVFFDWNRAELTNRAKEIIGEAATASRTVQTTRIEVQGHADRSGSDAYNMRLSRHRADNVAAELVRRGVERSIITIEAFGESRPLVPTADGVREPQNRRVEIILR